MNADLEQWIEYWRSRLFEAQDRLNREQFAECADIHRLSIANYRRWIAAAEKRMAQ